MLPRRISPILAACLAALVAAPASAEPPSCLARQGHVEPAAIRGVHIGAQAQIGGTGAQPASVTYCVADGGELSFAVDREASIVLVATTSTHDSWLDVAPGRRWHSTSKQRSLGTSEGAALLAIPGTQLVAGVRAHRVAFLAATDRLLLENPPRLRYWLHRLDLG